MKRAYGVGLILTVLVYSAAMAGPAVRMHTADPLATDLWPDAGPASMRAVSGPNPLAMTAARGETESVLLIAEAARDCAGMTVQASDLKQGTHTIKGVQVRVVRSVRRATPYAMMVGRRYRRHYSRRTGMLLPDILVADEPGLEGAVKKWAGHLPDGLDVGPARTGPIPAQQFKYVLVTVKVAAGVAPGMYVGRLSVTAEGTTTQVPLRLTVYPFVLTSETGRILGISNEFCRPHNTLMEASLRLTGEVGMTFTRTGDVLADPKWRDYLALFRKYGFLTVSQTRPPRRRLDVKAIPEDFRWYFYGRDEPQPKDAARKDWSRLAEHVRLSQEVRQKGGKIMTSLPYTLAMALRRRDSKVYESLAKLGLRGAYEPLDWANVGLGVQRLGRRQRPEEGNAELFAYIGKLQEEFRTGEWKPNAPALPSKHTWVETYYWPQGMIRYPYFARLLFGFYLFNSHLDGAMAWTLYRTRGQNPLVDGSEPVATLAYPGMRTLYGTYSLEAIREGVDDLRYAVQAYRAVARLLASSKEPDRQSGKALRTRFLELLAPYTSLTPEGTRIDRAVDRPERQLGETRRALAGIIQGTPPEGGG